MVSKVNVPLNTLQVILETVLQARCVSMEVDV